MKWLDDFLSIMEAGINHANNQSDLGIATTIPLDAFEFSETKNFLTARVNIPRDDFGTHTVEVEIARLRVSPLNDDFEDDEITQDGALLTQEQWQIAFYVDGSMVDATGEGYEMQIIAVVQAAVEYFLNMYRPLRIKFHAADHEGYIGKIKVRGSQERVGGRERVYRIFARGLTRKYGYTDFSEGRDFLLVRDDEAQGEVFDPTGAKKGFQLGYFDEEPCDYDEVVFQSSPEISFSSSPRQYEFLDTNEVELRLFPDESDKSWDTVYEKEYRDEEYRDVEPYNPCITITSFAINTAIGVYCEVETYDDDDEESYSAIGAVVYLKGAAGVDMSTDPSLEQVIKEAASNNVAYLEDESEIDTLKIYPIEVPIDFIFSDDNITDVINSKIEDLYTESNDSSLLYAVAAFGYYDLAEESTTYYEIQTQDHFEKSEGMAFLEEYNGDFGASGNFEDACAYDWETFLQEQTPLYHGSKAVWEGDFQRKRAASNFQWGGYRRSSKKGPYTRGKISGLPLEGFFLAPHPVGSFYYLDEAYAHGLSTNKAKLKVYYLAKGLEIWDYRNPNHVEDLVDCTIQNSNLIGREDFQFGRRLPDGKLIIEESALYEKLSQGDWTYIQHPLLLDCMRFMGFDGFINYEDYALTGHDGVKGLSLAVFHNQALITENQLYDIYLEICGDQ